MIHRSVVIGIVLVATAFDLMACSDYPATEPREPKATAPSPGPHIHNTQASSQQIPVQAFPTVPARTNLPMSMQVSPTPHMPDVIQLRSKPVPTIHVPPAFPFLVKDSNGNEVFFDKPPERIVAFDSAVVEILFAIGEGHRIVATHDFVSYPPETIDIPRVGGAFNLDIETTVSLEPDLVLVFFDQFLDDLDRTGLKVLYMKTLTDDFTQVANRVRLLGGIVGNPSTAEVLALDFEARVDAIKATMAPYATGPKVFQDEGDLWTPGQGTLIQQVFDLLKLENIAADVMGYGQLSPEVIVDRDPAIIIASYGDNISDMPVFADILAVREKTIYVPSSDSLSIAGPRFVSGIEELAAWVYPDLFK